MILVNRHVDHKVEWYYDEPQPERRLLQYVLFNEIKLHQKYKSILNIYESSDFYDEKEDYYGIYNVEDDFQFLITSDFYSFFITNNIDIPRCFRPIRSVKRPINEINFLKFNNYLMREGKRLKTLKTLNMLILSIQKDYPTLKDIIFKTPANWRDFYFIFNSLKLTQKYNQLFFVKNEITSYGNVHTNLFIDILTNWNDKKIFFRNLYDLLPTFCFYIYKVDKQIFKNTRGKSGKYTFIWKYVAPYKRQFLVMFWLAKELRITPGRAFHNRLLQLMHTFVFNPQNTLAFKAKKFSHNYVYRNCRYTLAEHYRTVTR